MSLAELTDLLRITLQSAWLNSRRGDLCWGVFMELEWNGEIQIFRWLLQIRRSILLSTMVTRLRCCPFEDHCFCMDLLNIGTKQIVDLRPLEMWCVDLGSLNLRQNWCKMTPWAKWEARALSCEQKICCCNS